MTDKNFAMNLMSSIRMPVGKYKGQDLDVVMASDPGYVEWISQQEWFRQQHAQVYKMIVNGCSDIQESPEHNALQARFLDETMRNTLADWYLPKPDAEDIEGIVESEIDWLRAKGGPQNEHKARIFEKYRYREATIAVSTTAPVFEDLGIDASFSCRRHITVRGMGRMVIEVEGAENKLNIEVKPTMGDDYPTVLRQILAARMRYRNRIVNERANAYIYPGIRGGAASVRAAAEHAAGPAENINGFVLVAEKYTGSCVPVEQVKAFFKAQNISVALLSDL
jgi:hypothetical protein